MIEQQQIVDAVFGIIENTEEKVSELIVYFRLFYYVIDCLFSEQLFTVTDLNLGNHV